MGLYSAYTNARDGSITEAVAEMVFVDLDVFFMLRPGHRVLLVLQGGG